MLAIRMVNSAFHDRQAKVGCQYTAEGVGGHTNGHADPQGGYIAFVPGSLGDFGWRDIVVVQRTVLNVGFDIQLVKFTRLSGLGLIVLHHLNSYRYCCGADCLL